MYLTAIKRLKIKLVRWHGACKVHNDSASTPSPFRSCHEALGPLSDRFIRHVPSLCT